MHSHQWLFTTRINCRIIEKTISFVVKRAFSAFRQNVYVAGRRRATLDGRRKGFDESGKYNDIISFFFSFESFARLFGNFVSKTDFDGTRLLSFLRNSRNYFPENHETLWKKPCSVWPMRLFIVTFEFFQFDDRINENNISHFPSDWAYSE